MPPPTASDLIFSEQANHNFSRTLGDLKRSTLTIQNRLQSILHDAAFAQQVAGAYSRPLIANERCGSWYIDPETKGGSAYFKSTDGHTGVWKFSSRRLNLHLLEIIGKHDGCIIIDSTRRGKRMPDALCKTIPIWCSVLNRFLFPEQPKFHELYTPPQIVSQSEHAQIAALLPSFVAALEALNIYVADLKHNVPKPLRPIWVTPESNVTPTSSIFEDFHPVICCTVSRRVAGGENSEGGYIQGAGDDTENWAHGLSPPVFWANREVLLSTPETELPNFIENLVARTAAAGTAKGQMRCLKPASHLFIGSISDLPVNSMLPAAFTIILLPKITGEDTWRTSPTRLDVGLGPHKLGSRNLRTALPFIIDFFRRSLTLRKTERGQEDETTVLIACETGKDLSIGVALAFLCLFFDDHGKLVQEPSREVHVDKTFIRSRLGWISTSMPDGNPSRATLQSVNSFLMERPR
ncbi:tRNA a64-2'-o-ribosylphosphate transferas-like protein [Hyaloscypha variabilis F]|uniref:tRNA a64-2'-o-ribosylphosphate transferas-like protein n=1 Tax=Hyaloscypha variabilis (strain UAMH 11265 / GT02V1 / F) TaxID=1149755 RepID=A0A2J6RY75_HYAVF|nr:tRNA a64-2'-o-ribosylphosphate transferas-like protein [Hyaloscypha variabilis F]